MAMWPDDEHHDSRIDTAIDEVARRMTEVAPDPAFKARVLARIGLDADAVNDRRAEALRHAMPWRRWRLAWMLSPLAVAALVIIAVVVFRGPSPNRDVVQGLPGRDSGPAMDVAPAPRVTTRPGGDTEPTETARHASASVRQRRPAPRTLVPPSEVDALAPPPLEVESIALSEIDPASSIEVPRLETIAPITLAPIGEGDRP